MFAGLMGLECLPANYTDSSRSVLQRCEVMEGGKASGSFGSGSRKSLHRRPGYMRGEAVRLQSPTAGAELQATGIQAGEPSCLGTECHSDITKPPNTVRSQAPVVQVSSLNQRQPAADTHTPHSWKSFHSSPTLSVPPVEFNVVKNAPSAEGWSSTPGGDLVSSLGPARSPCPAESRLTPPRESFNSSFSFIQQSLRNDTAADPEPLDHLTPASVSDGLLGAESIPEYLSSNALQTKPAALFSGQTVPTHLTPVQSQTTTALASQSEREELCLGDKFWRERPWHGREITSDIPDCDSSSLDTEFTSSLSVDSDTASASSVTSGYESATPSSDQGWDNLVKKYEDALQSSLQNNRTNTKIESMMLKLQRLQQKAIFDDDYDTAEHFGKKLEELSREQGALKLGLPSRQPSVSLFLERLRQAIHSALQRADQRRDGIEPDTGQPSDHSGQSPLNRRDQLIKEKRLVEAEISELQRRLSELRARSLGLEQQIRQEDQQVETEELESSVLRSCSVAQLHDMSRALHDLLTCENRTQIWVSPPASSLRLQEQEQALNLSIKEATAKVVMSQRLGGSLRRKVSETETQLLTLHEAKLAAISGNDFASAKELKAEIKAVNQERERLEGLAKRLHSLNSGHSQELARMKAQQHQLRQELEQREAQHESRLKENAAKYIELLEDRLHSCGCPALERVWEADLEACHLFLRGLQLHTPSYRDTEDLPPTVARPDSTLSTKKEEDCAMLTALGGRWCPEANLQNSEFTKKLEEFLFCMEDNHPEYLVKELGHIINKGDEAVDLTDQCELISDRLMTLEEELQTAMLNRDRALTQSLEKEVCEVKATLQTMLAQLRVEDEDEEAVNGVQDGDSENGIEEEEEEKEEEEDQYFSDSWDI